MKTGTFKNYQVTIPEQHILLVTLDRPDKLNCIDKATSRAVESIWNDFDQDEDLWVGIITGKGRAFCTGADLHEWHDMNKAGIVNSMDAPGLAGLCRREGKKPIIAAVNGITMGGGFEMIANCDMILASHDAQFALPEVKRGIVPVAGCLPRLARTIGMQRTMDLVLTGRSVNATELAQWGLINTIVHGDVVQEAVRVAKAMCQNSPDALFIARRGVRMAWEDGHVESSVARLANEWYPLLVKGENFHEGIKAYAEKRKPRWSNPKL
ncbi:enoyl-CoA hydratase/isomerase family protein [Elsinoe ampelina]|uniref:Enoyl-CoA hydratase/isomerase family protein n=1 Tax=Elsinoe ampelina TaxID=302913 RepID=A0A6A6G5S7_9PEZI|nr:enoyl-CoA hydratase/isomerase family protein [Elsinoe ampelina]